MRQSRALLKSRNRLFTHQPQSSWSVVCSIVSYVKAVDVELPLINPYCLLVKRLCCLKVGQKSYKAFVGWADIVLMPKKSFGFKESIDFNTSAYFVGRNCKIQFVIVQVQFKVVFLIWIVLFSTVTKKLLKQFAISCGSLMCFLFTCRLSWLSVFCIIFLSLFITCKRAFD